MASSNKNNTSVALANATAGRFFAGQYFYAYFYFYGSENTRL